MTGLGRRNLLITVVVVLLIFGALQMVRLFSYRPPSHLIAESSLNENTKIGRIGSGYFEFEIADTPQERRQGLSGKSSLGDTKAMLFVFDKPGKECIWMKDMRFNLDILWFDAQKKLIYEKRNVAPSTYPEQFCPDKEATYVVEMTANVADKNHIKLGDKLEIAL